MTTAEMEAVSVRIDHRFCGPDGVGNGGYAAGLMISRFAESAEVTLYRPPPLDRDLHFDWSAGILQLRNDVETIAVAEPAEMSLRVPAPPSWEEVVAASRHRLRAEDHPFPNCFVCGPPRSEGDGMRLGVGPVAGRDLVAAPWIPAEEFGAGTRLVRDGFVCAALDCPGAFAAPLRRPAVLGRFAVTLERPVLTGERYLVIGWSLGSEGRKHQVGTALFSADGRLHGSARATWVELRKRTIAV